jgi:hypothetical protein
LQTDTGSPYAAGACSFTEAWRRAGGGLHTSRHRGHCECLRQSRCLMSLADALPRAHAVLLTRLPLAPTCVAHAASHCHLAAGVWDDELFHRMSSLCRSSRIAGSITIRDVVLFRTRHAIRSLVLSATTGRSAAGRACSSASASLPSSLSWMLCRGALRLVLLAPTAPALVLHTITRRYAADCSIWVGRNIP